MAPMPEPADSGLALQESSAETDAELSVVMLPKQPAAEDSPMVTPPPSPNPVTSREIAPKPLRPAEEEPLLQTDIIPEAAPPAPSLPTEPATPESWLPEDLPSTPSPEANLLPEPEPTPNPQYGEPITATPAGPLINYDDTFPHFEGAVGGCFGFTECRRVSGAGSYRAVARSLIADLETQGYGVELRDDLEDTGRNVYELLPPDEDTKKYLLVFSDMDGSAIYVMSDEIMTLSDLQALQVQTESSDQSS